MSVTEDALACTDHAHCEAWRIMVVNLLKDVIDRTNGVADAIRLPPRPVDSAEVHRLDRLPPSTPCAGCGHRVSIHKKFYAGCLALQCPCSGFARLSP